MRGGRTSFARCGRDLFETIDAPRTEQQLCALAGEGQCCRFAKSTRSACDQNPFVGESHLEILFVILLLTVIFSSLLSLPGEANENNFTDKQIALGFRRAGLLTQTEIRIDTTTTSVVLPQSSQPRMRKHKTHRLGDLQLKIMKVLWQRGESTVGDVFDAVGKE